MHILLNPFYRRLLLTLSLVILYRLEILIPIPFVDHDVLGELFGRYQPFDRDVSKRVSIDSTELQSIFFGPYLEMGLWVRAKDAATVRETLRTCYGGLGI